MSEQPSSGSPSSLEYSESSSVPHSPSTDDTAREPLREPLEAGKSAKECSAQGSSWPSCNLAKTALWCSIGGGFNFGYQLIITNPAQEALIQFLNDSYANTHNERLDRAELEYIWGPIVSSLFWGATIGSLLIQAVSDRLGRKYGIIANFSLQVISMGLSVLSQTTGNYILYTISRILLGIGLSISIGIAPLFILECSPLSCRGMVSMSTGIMLQIGLVAGAITAMPQIFGTVEMWWMIYALEGALTLLVTIFMFCCPESPTFLVSKGKMEEAGHSVAYYYGITESETKAVLDGMKTAGGGSGEKPLGLFEILTNKTWLCGFLVGVGIMAGAVLCGVAVVNAFAFEILMSVGLNALEASIGNMVICIMAVIGALVSSRLIENIGRRPLLIYTFGGLALVNALISGFMLGFEKSQITLIGWGVVVSCCIFNLLFAAGPGPLCLFVGGELVGANAKAATFTWMNIAMNGLRSLLLVVWFPLKNLLGAPICYFILFFPVCALSLALCYFCQPETTGKTPEEAKEAMKHLPRLCGKAETEADAAEVQQKLS